jgi:integrase
VSIIPAGIATFNFKFTDPATGKQRSTVLGTYNPETFTVEDARSKVYGLKAMAPAALAEQLRQTKTVQAGRGKTVGEIIEERIDWMKQHEPKEDGEERPRIESWENVASHLRRFVKPRLGRKIASDVTRDDIAELSNDILAGKFGKPSRSNARHMRRAVSGLYTWASEAGRKLGIPETCRPTYNLPKLPKEPPRKRVLSEDEIRTLWHGLDRDDLPWDRRTRLAIKSELVTMLRSAELIAAHRNELVGLDGDAPLFRVPTKRVKKRRAIEQPLSDLAIEIIREALASEAQEFVFESPVYPGQPLHRTVMSTAHQARNLQDQDEDAWLVRTARPEAAHDPRPAPHGSDASRRTRLLGGRDCQVPRPCRDQGRWREGRSGNRCLCAIKADAAEARGAQRHRGRAAADRR